MALSHSPTDNRLSIGKQVGTANQDLPVVKLGQVRVVDGSGADPTASSQRGLRSGCRVPGCSSKEASSAQPSESLIVGEVGSKPRGEAAAMPVVPCKVVSPYRSVDDVGRTRTQFVCHDHIERAVDVRPGIPLDIPDNGLLWLSRHCDAATLRVPRGLHCTCCTDWTSTRGGAEGEGEEGRRGKCGFVAISPASQAGTRRRRLATSSERGKAKRRDKEPMHEDRHRPSFSVTAIPFQADLTQPPPRPKVSVARCSDNCISAWPLVVDLVPRCAHGIGTSIAILDESQTRADPDSDPDPSRP